MKKIIFTIFSTMLFITMFSACKKQKEVDVFTASWEDIVKTAEGQHVLFNAWGGDTSINNYIQWVKTRVKETYDINLTHVLVKDGQEGPRKIQQEKIAGNHSNGSVDILWLNGTAFHTLNNQKLFLGNILSLIPNKQYIDKNNSVLYEDFTMPTEGQEIPWGTAQLMFFHSNKVAPFQSFKDIITVIKNYPNTFSYPSVDLDFTGRTFIKNLIYIFAKDTSLFYKPYSGLSEQDRALSHNKVWNILDELHPYLWRKGKTFPQSYSEMVALFKDGELDYGITFNPFFTLNKVVAKEFSKDVASFIPIEGTVSNAHFLTIPYNSGSKEASLVVINFLLSPEAQARKANPNYWGDPSVLDLDVLTIQSKHLFKNELQEYNAYPPAGVGRDTVREFHSSWEQPIRDFWKARYIE